MAKRAVTNQRKAKELIATNTMLKRQVRDLQHALHAYEIWEAKIHTALSNNDVVRAFALFKGERPHGTD
jgi:hypothetical protein